MSGSSKAAPDARAGIPPAAPAQPSRLRSAVNGVGSFIGSILSGFFRGVLYWKETTIILPLVIGLLCLVCMIILIITGRQLLNDLGGLVDTGFTFLKLACVFAMTGGVQKALFGYRTESGGDGSAAKQPPLSNDIYDGVVTFGVMLFIGVPVFWF